jgi:ABC-type Fe2+-enterobactin transport system substrate-binding protein
MTKLKITSGIVLEELKSYFNEYYSYLNIDCSDITDTELVQWLNQNYVFKLGKDLAKVCDLLRDHLLANDLLPEIQE